MLWQRAITRLVDLAPPVVGMTTEPYVSMRRYPACILLYASGVACVIAKKYDTLKILMKDQRTRIDFPYEGQDSPLISKLAVPFILTERALDMCSNPERNRYPASMHLHRLLRETMRSFLPNDSEYDDAFDRFEYLYALAYSELSRGVGAPIGRFGLKYSGLFPSSSSDVGQALLAEHAFDGNNWGLLTSGVFKTSEAFLAAEKKLREYVTARASY